MPGNCGYKPLDTVAESGRVARVARSSENDPCLRFGNFTHSQMIIDK